MGLVLLRPDYWTILPTSSAAGQACGCRRLRLCPCYVEGLRGLLSQSQRALDTESEVRVFTFNSSRVSILKLELLVDGIVVYVGLRPLREDLPVKVTAEPHGKSEIDL